MHAIKFQEEIPPILMLPRNAAYLKNEIPKPEPQEYISYCYVYRIPSKIFQTLLPSKPSKPLPNSVTQNHGTVEFK